MPNFCQSTGFRLDLFIAKSVFQNSSIETTMKFLSLLPKLFPNRAKCIEYLSVDPIDPRSR